MDSVPSYLVTNDNLHELWPHICSAIQKASFIGLDLELSGLGPRTSLYLKQIDERYKAIAEVAKTRSILSFGLSTFKLIPYSDEDQEDEPQSIDDEQQFSCETYNIICHCEDEYVSEPDAIKFLTDHGFDFDLQNSSGVKYYRGSDKDEISRDYKNPGLRTLFNILVREKVPLVLHNGFIDLIFLYQNFYCELPAELQIFVTDLGEIFPSGIYDTKYIADNWLHLEASYLEYVFYERQRINFERTLEHLFHVSLIFSSPSLSSKNEYKEQRNLKTSVLTKPDHVIVCMEYKSHGHCTIKESCPNSHNIDYILDTSMRYKHSSSKRRSKTMKKMKEACEIDNHNKSDENQGDNYIENKLGIHSSGFDAFMTGYSFCIYLTPNLKQWTQSRRLPKSIAQKVVNNLYLSGKKDPLKILKSSFSKPSDEHGQKIKRIFH